jgi:hypothetical protein
MVGNKRIKVKFEELPNRVFYYTSAIYSSILNCDPITNTNCVPLPESFRRAWVLGTGGKLYQISRFNYGSTSANHVLVSLKSPNAVLVEFESDPFLSSSYSIDNTHFSEGIAFAKTYNESSQMCSSSMYSA